MLSGRWARRAEAVPPPLLTRSPEETLALGRALAARLQPGDILLLHGDLGAGKTVLVRGLSLGLGLGPDQVSSPTFALVHEYPGQVTIIHVDLYRLPALEVEFLMELEDYWQQPVITVIEWAERLGTDLPEAYLDLTLVWVDETTRAVEVCGVGSRGQELAAACRTLWPALARSDQIAR